MNGDAAPDGLGARLGYGYRRLRTFLRQDLWTVNPTGRLPRFLIHFLRTMVLVTEGSIRSDVLLLSAGLTYQVIFSIIPLFVVMLAFFKGFGGMTGLGDRVREFLLTQFSAGQLGEQIKPHLDQFVEQTNATTTGIIGFVALVVILFSLLSSMEKSFNRVWGVHTYRPLLRRFTVYWAIVTVAPLFLAMSITASGFLQSQTAYVWLTEHVPFFDVIVLRLTPFVFAWIVFTIIYVMMPNTQVNFGSALVGAVIAGTVWEFAKTGYVWYNTHFVAAYKIYGSLGAIPVFLLWVYISWVVVLVGAEISYAYQNVRTYRREIESPIVSQSFKEKLAVVVMMEACRPFLAGEKPPTAASLAEKLNVPRRTVADVAHLLVEQKMLRELRALEKEDPGLVPARDPESIRVRDVVEAIHRFGAEPAPLPNGPLGDLDSLVREERARDSNFKSLAAAQNLGVESTPPRS
jgi:membrane protein